MDTHCVSVRYSSQLIIANALFLCRLELPSLLSHLPKNDSNKNKGGKSKDKKQGQDVCHFFLRGHCKYGRRCRLRHVQPEQKPQKVDDKHLQTPQEHNVSYLEVRFPLSGYPRRPPLVCFRTELSHFPRPAALNITKRLLKEARELSKDEAPCVFTLVSLLESKDTVDHAVREDCCAFSFDEDFVPKDMNPSVSLAGVNAPDRKGGNDEGDGRGDLGDSRRKARDDFRRKMLVTNKRLKDRHRNRQKLSDPDNNDPIQAARRNLPAWQEQDRLLSALKRSQVVVVSGATGCGKSTQVPQFILDEWLLSGKDNQICNIICTQPRRISAIGVAERVAAERNEGTVGSNMVGYQIRMESRTCNFTRLLFCTTGILLRRLGSDPDLDCVSHVVVDEVHERSEEADFLLMVLRDLLARRKDLKVILMSATLNADMFADYFGGPKAVPVIEIPGRTFPVEQVRQHTGARQEPHCTDLFCLKQLNLSRVLLVLLGGGPGHDGLCPRRRLRVCAERYEERSAATRRIVLAEGTVQRRVHALPRRSHARPRLKRRRHVVQASKRQSERRAVDSEATSTPVSSLLRLSGRKMTVPSKSL